MSDMNHEIDPSQKGQPTPEQIGARRLPLQEQIGKKVGEIRARVKNTLGLRSRDLSPQEQADRRKILQTGVALGVGGALFGASIFEQPSAHADPQPPITPEGVPTPEPGEAGEGEPSLNAPSSSEPAPIPATPGPEKPKTAAEVGLSFKETDVELIPNEELVEKLRLSSEDEAEWKRNKPWVINTFVKAGQLFGSEGIIQPIIKKFKPSGDGRIRDPNGRIFLEYFPENSPVTASFSQRFAAGYEEPAIAQWMLQNPKKDMIIPSIAIFGAAVKRYTNDLTTIKPLVDTNIAFTNVDIIHRHVKALYSNDGSSIKELWLKQALNEANSMGIKNDFDKRNKFYDTTNSFAVYAFGQALWETVEKLTSDPNVQRRIAEGNYRIDTYTQLLIKTKNASGDAISFMKNARDIGLMRDFPDSVLIYGSQFT